MQNNKRLTQNLPILRYFSIWILIFIIRLERSCYCGIAHFALLSWSFGLTNL